MNYNNQNVKFAIVNNTFFSCEDRIKETIYLSSNGLYLSKYVENINLLMHFSCTGEKQQYQRSIRKASFSSETVFLGQQLSVCLLSIYLKEYPF